MNTAGYIYEIDNGYHGNTNSHGSRSYKGTITCAMIRHDEGWGFVLVLGIWWELPRSAWFKVDSDSENKQ